MFKVGWFNQNQKGIHFEVYIGDREMERQKTHLVMHVLHSDTFPGTDLQRDAFIRPFLATSHGIWKRWKGYRVSETTMTVLSSEVRFTDETLVDVLFHRFTQIQELGTIVDDVIEKALR